MLVQAVLAIAAGRSGGPESQMLPWIVLPTAFSAARFRGQVVVADVALGIALLGATLGVSAGDVAHHPEGVLVTVVLMISITAIVFVLSAAEVEQRGEAVLDHLTGLLNRTSLQRRFEELAQQAALSDEPISLIVFDLDAFKAINDEQGHARGDVVLRDVAYLVRKQLRSFELVYRLGGEEFLVVLPGADAGRGGRRRQSPALRGRKRAARWPPGDGVVRRGHGRRRAGPLRRALRERRRLAVPREGARAQPRRGVAVDLPLAA